MFRRAWLLSIVAVAVVAYWTVAHAQQHPVMDAIANKVIQKYQQSSCEELWQKKNEPKSKSPQEEKVTELLRTDAQLRTEFLNKVAAPIANKMFECRLIP